MSSGAERLQAVVLAYGDGARLGAVVGALLGEGVAAESVLVVHNPAQPGEAPPSLPEGCELVAAERNLGYAGGMNLGIRVARVGEPELLLLLTHDARLHPGALPALLAAAGAQPRLGVVAPALVLAGSGDPFSFGGVTRPSGTNAHRRQPGPTSAAGVAGCDWVDGGTMLVRAAALDAAGGFDEGFWGYCEEADLCLRVRRAGFEVGVVPAALADQEPGGAKRPGAWSYLLTRNGAEYARRAVGPRGAATVCLRACGFVCFDLLRAAGRAARGRDRGEPWATAVGTARGVLDFLRRRWGPPPPDLPGIGDLSNA
jgi:N-acetylglucosaminyl-diphospho-decaprenol L-rhamnosyltransferase